MTQTEGEDATKGKVQMEKEGSTHEDLYTLPANQLFSPLVWPFDNPKFPLNI